VSQDAPSVTDLKRDIDRIVAQESGWTYSRDRIVEAAPALLEIAAAAQAFVETQGDRIEPEWGGLMLALLGVRR
jgi:hypothetical protein